MSADGHNRDDGPMWYHGSPAALETIRAGSTITQDRDIARVFSHKPSMVSVESASGGQRIAHNGTGPGFLYRISDDVGPNDVEPHPRSTMDEGTEWLTRRELRVTLIERTMVRPDELLSEDQVRRFEARARRAARPSGA